MNRDRFALELIARVIRSPITPLSIALIESTLAAAQVATDVAELEHPMVTLADIADRLRAELCNFDRIPIETRDQIDRWVRFGAVPAPEIRMLLKGHWHQAMAILDGAQMIALPAIWRMLKMAPADCWGSSEAFTAWLERGGLQGRPS